MIAVFTVHREDEARSTFRLTSQAGELRLAFRELNSFQFPCESCGSYRPPETVEGSDGHYASAFGPTEAVETRAACPSCYADAASIHLAPIQNPHFDDELGSALGDRLGLDPLSSAITVSSLRELWHKLFVEFDARVFPTHPGDSSGRWLRLEAERKNPDLCPTTWTVG